MDGDIGVKLCGNPSCGKPLVRRANEPAYRWRERTSCDVVCGRRAGALKSHQSGARERKAELAVSLMEPEYFR